MEVQFPKVEGCTLSGAPHRLPGTLTGDRNLLLVAVKRWQQADVETWIPFAEAIASQMPDFRAYELPLISQLYRASSGIIDGGIRDPQAREATITLYINRNQFLDDLRISAVSAIVPMLVTPKGKILWRTTGRRSAEPEASLRQVPGKI